ncbi:type I restriction enzyme HsdR N-terminal domain-containing protein [Thermus filiformis]|uniref:Uncharacterized protein n=1 Tax=Thermus filiformis TaxID=276 RepID=A0A0A2WLH6_THEFI|nr:type I restriction enzyme HsdR N-terminal domain-containing protein [Thermus filiformis]KGQ21041.1 hypothetical protein THFILI_08595 [Thermus filiformis]
MHSIASRLKERLERWRSRGLNEEATLLGLVLPVLQMAGYDPFDPEEVFPQPRDSNALKPDLALYSKSPLEGGNPWMVVEVKALGEALEKEKYYNQVTLYMNGVPEARWYALTNGEEWMFFDRDRPRALPLKENVLLRVRISDPGALEALRALLDKENAKPRLEEARRILAEARLRQLAREAPWEKQTEAYHITHSLPARVRQEAEAILKDLGPQIKDFVQKWQEDYEEALKSGKPPDWWEDAPSSPPTSPAQPSTPLPGPGPYTSWSDALYAVAVWCYEQDPKRTEEVFKLFSQEDLGWQDKRIHSRLLPGGEKKVKLHYSTKGKKRLLKRAARVFPELKGLELRVNGETFRLE